MAEADFHQKNFRCSQNPSLAIRITIYKHKVDALNQITQTLDGMDVFFAHEVII